MVNMIVLFVVGVLAWFFFFFFRTSFLIELRFSLTVKEVLVVCHVVVAALPCSLIWQLA